MTHAVASLHMMTDKDKPYRTVIVRMTNSQQLPELSREIVERILLYVPRNELCKVFDVPNFADVARELFAERYDLQVTVNCNQTPWLFDFGLWDKEELENSIAPERFRSYRWKWLTLKKIKLTDFLHSLNCCPLEKSEFNRYIGQSVKTAPIDFVAEQPIPDFFHPLSFRSIKLVRKPNHADDTYKEFLKTQADSELLEKLEFVGEVDIQQFTDVLLKLFERPNFKELVLSTYDSELNQNLARSWLNCRDSSKTVQVPLSGDAFVELESPEFTSAPVSMSIDAKFM
ncbi:hypothetical protein QR680_019320 [Steinernema hermaphroditum]|uniref:Uncharacterized protein n=1 Tax=Steinernema hermaphroditum TaxID=289476 RepID=A0AA39GPF3_9BILA|nr:hypothetical protein QR680_019320 [Steinernema hermaphroditum]